MFKSASASFTITVVLVSLFGAAFLASLCLWIIGDWSEGGGPLLVAIKIIWGTWWVLAIATVLVRVAIFGAHRRRARQEKERRDEPDGQAPPAADPVPLPPRTPNGNGSAANGPSQTTEKSSQPTHSGKSS